ncbi:MAG: hypothetical protein ABH803_03280 [Candidatus Micrarchaeota archaeon]
MKKLLLFVLLASLVFAVGTNNKNAEKTYAAEITGLVNSVRVVTAPLVARGEINASVSVIRSKTLIQNQLQTVDALRVKYNASNLRVRVRECNREANCVSSLQRNVVAFIHAHWNGFSKIFDELIELGFPESKINEMKDYLQAQRAAISNTTNKTEVREILDSTNEKLREFRREALRFMLDYKEDQAINNTTEILGKLEQVRLQLVERGINVTVFDEAANRVRVQLRVIEDDSQGLVLEWAELYRLKYSLRSLKQVVLKKINNQPVTPSDLNASVSEDVLLNAVPEMVHAEVVQAFNNGELKSVSEDSEED